MELVLNTIIACGEQRLIRRSSWNLLDLTPLLANNRKPVDVDIFCYVVVDVVTQQRLFNTCEVITIDVLQLDR